MRISDWSSDVCSSDLAAVDMDDLAPIVGLGAQLADQRCIVAIGHKADVLAVGLGRDAQAQVACDFAHHALSKPAQRKAQEIELLLRRREQEIALVACRDRKSTRLNSSH